MPLQVGEEIFRVGTSVAGAPGSTQALRMLRQRPGHVLAHQWRRMVTSGFQRGEYLGR